MKPPRDFLFERHKGATEKLDALRQEAVRAAVETSRPAPIARRFNFVEMLLQVLLAPFRHIVWPARRIWAGFAVAWLVIVLVNVKDANRATELAGSGRMPSAETLAAWQQQQQRLMAELMRQTDGGTADRPKNSAPQPRSQWPARPSAG